MARDVPWKIHQNAAMAFPHTMHDVIVVPPTFFSWDEERQVSVLVHEKVHLWQKRYPCRIRAFVQSVMGYRQVGSLTMAMRRAMSVRANPDTDDGLYAQHGSNAFCLMVYRGDAAELGDARLVTVGQGGTSKYEHPFEEMAYEVTRAVLQGRLPASIAAML